MKCKTERVKKNERKNGGGFSRKISFLLYFLFIECLILCYWKDFEFQKLKFGVFTFLYLWVFIRPLSMVFIFSWDFFSYLLQVSPINAWDHLLCLKGKGRWVLLALKFLNINQTYV
jgi:hypothetical protein